MIKKKQLEMYENNVRKCTTFKLEDIGKSYNYYT